MTDTKYVYEREMEVRDYELDAEGIVNNAIICTIWSIPAMAFAWQTAFRLRRCRRRV